MNVGDVVRDICDGKLKTVGEKVGKNRRRFLWFEGSKLCTSIYYEIQEFVVKVPKELHGRLAESGIALAWKATVIL